MTACQGKVCSSLCLLFCSLAQKISTSMQPSSIHAAIAQSAPEYEHGATPVDSGSADLQQDAAARTSSIQDDGCLAVEHSEDGDSDTCMRQPLTMQNRSRRKQQKDDDGNSQVPENAFEPFEKLDLPPKLLEPLTVWQICLLFLEVILVGAVFVGVLKGILVIVEWSTLLSIPSMVEDCGGYSVPSAERVFYINVQLVKNISFTQAKLLDLAWDTLVGQGGRFLHAWVLYHVAASAIGWMMEYSAVPYNVQVHMLFSTVSLEALWSSMLLISKNQPRRMVASGLWLFLAILYALAFPSLWSAATGYLQPSAVAYKMSDLTYATVDSDALNLCWSVEADRLNGALPGVVLGPRLRSCFSSFTSLDDVFSMQCSFTNDTSDAWKALYIYAMTKSTVQYFYTRTSSWDPLPANYTIDFNNLEYELDTFGDLTWKISVESSRDPRGLYREFTGFEFRFDGNMTEDTFGMVSNVPFSTTTFQLNTSIPLNASDLLDTYGMMLEPVPYNSTLRINNTELHLDAPFLDLNYGCDYSTDSWEMDFCICYHGTPLTSDFRTSDKLTCISEDRYVWGFSGVITLIGIIVEMCWIVGCFGMWLDVHINSSLFRMNRPVSGTIRNIIDVASAVQKDLGRDIGAYSDGDLKEALRKCPPVGYEVEVGDKIDRIGFVSIPRPRQRRSALKLRPGRLYA